MNLITLDFETYYDKEYSLSKMTTEEYIRHKQFETIGVSVQVNDEPPQWCTGDNTIIANFLREFDWANSVALAHNAVFDMAILNWWYGINPRRIADTLSMARALHGTEVGGSLKVLAQHYGVGEKGTEVLDALGKRREDFTPEQMRAYGEYCKNDVTLTYKIFNRMLEEGFPLVELKLIDLTIKMFSDPVLRLNKEELEQHNTKVKSFKLRLLAQVDADPSALRSDATFAHLLQQAGVVAPMKVSKATGNMAYAFAKSDEEFIALQEHPSPVVQALVAARLGTKSTIEESRTQRFIDIANRGSLPIPLRYYAAHTGRWGGDDKINMQNLPRTSALKDAIEAPPGYMFVDCDSAQIEARTLAWFAGQDDLVQAFARGEDVYRIMASAIYGKSPADIDKGERFVGKTTILGCGYGMGGPKFQAQLKTFKVDMEADECARVISVYRTQYPRIPELWKQAQQALRAMLEDKTVPLGPPGVVLVEGRKGIRLPNGLYLKYPNLRLRVDDTTGKTEMVYDTKKGRAIIPTRIYGGKLVENICQALARIIIGEQMLRIAKKFRVVMTVHDAVGSIVPEQQAQTGLEYVQLCMRIPPVWAEGLPLNCEGGFGKAYGTCK